MVENVNEYTQELINKIRTIKTDLNDDIHAINYSLERAILDLEISDEIEKVLGRLEQLETRQLEQDFFTKKMLTRILENLEGEKD